MGTAAADTDELYQPLLQAFEEFDVQARRNPKLRGHEAEAIRTFRHGLRTWELRPATFRYLAWTSTEFTVAVVDDLLYLAGSDRHTMVVCELLGRLPYDQAQKLVPPAVTRTLEGDDVDYGDWFRMADTLHYLGLYDALRELVARARDHIDGDVRELADTYGDA